MYVPLTNRCWFYRIRIYLFSFTPAFISGEEDGHLLNGHSLDESNGDLSAQIPLDDDEPLSVDFAIVEAVQCLIDQHNLVFADSAELGWHDLDN